MPTPLVRESMSDKRFEILHILLLLLLLLL
jgi:hypothetical protein